MLALTACGPGKPVLLYVPPSVHADDRNGPRRPTEIVSASSTFWEAMANLDTAFVASHPVSDSQRAFARALGLMMSGNTAAAAARLDSIMKAPGDSLVKSASRRLITAMLQHQENWKALHELGSADTIGKSTDDRANVESWAAAFRSVAPRRISFSEQPVVLPLTLSLSGSPVIPAMINGKVRMLWIDTGSSMSILSSDIAAETGVEPLVVDTLEIVTTTGRVPARPAIIAHLELGGIDVANATAMIVDSARMHIRLGDGSDPAMAVRIDGVIGYDVISRLDVRIDYAARTVTLTRPERNAATGSMGRNLFWIGAPVVRLVTPGGKPLHFTVDTGGQETYATGGLIAKTRTRTFLGERRLIGGFSGLTIVKGRFIDELRVSLAGRPLVFAKMLVFAPAYSTFVAIDGVIGNDVGKGGAVRIDATNGMFILEAPVARRVLRPNG